MVDEEDMIASESHVENDVDVTETTESAQTEDKYSRRIILRVLRRVFSIELVALMHAFSSGLHIVIRTNLMIEKTCRVNLNFTGEICDDIEHHSAESDRVQQDVTELNLYNTFLSAIPCIIISLMIGPLSDRYGRRPVLLFPMIGQIIGQIVYLLNVYYWEARADFLLFAASYSLFGGNTTYLIGLYSYLADITSSDSRTSRLSVLDVSSISGFTAGIYLSAPLYQSLGFYGIFGITAGIYSLDFFFVLFFLAESSQALDIFRCVFGRREGEAHTRAIILILMSAMLLFVSGFSADIDYLFTRKMFSWTEAKYTEVTTGVTALTSLSSLVVLPLLSYRLGVPDIAIGILASLSLVTATVGTAFSRTGTHYIIASCVGLLGPQVSTVIRSQLSKVVTERELGKVYTMLGCLEAAIPLAASPLLTEIYNNTLGTFPGAVYLARAGFVLVELVLFLVVARLVRRDQATPGYHHLDHN